MPETKKNLLITATVLMLLFAAFTAAVATYDVQPIGPEGSSVGFASLNSRFAAAVGSSDFWYILTDWLSMIVLVIPVGFAALGLKQLIARKSLLKVDADILCLGVFYVVVLAFYVGFDQFVINYRPLLIEGVLEPSYPSSHTFIFLCVMGSTMLQLPRRLANRSLAAKLQLLCAAVVVLVIVGRVLSGVHWLTDIIGGLLLAAALLGYYYAAICK